MHKGVKQMSTDNHHAKKSGLHSETTTKSFIQRLGFQFYTTGKELRDDDINPWGTLYHKPPSDWPQLTNTGLQRKYISDGFIRLWLGSDCAGIILEQKNSTEHGTTEEKVFYDLMKIRKGVYGHKHKLWYLFTGDIAQSLIVFKEFTIEAKKLEDKITIIYGYDDLKRRLSKIDHYWSHENQIKRRKKRNKRKNRK